MATPLIGMLLAVAEAAARAWDAPMRGVQTSGTFPALSNTPVKRKPTRKGGKRGC